METGKQLAKNTPPVLDEYTLKYFKIRRYAFLFAIPFIIFAISYPFELIILDQSIERIKSYGFYIYLHQLWIIFIPLNIVLVIIYFQKMNVFLLDYFKLQTIGLFFIIPFLTTCISIFYIGTDISIKVIDTIYLTFLIWGIIGGRYYYKRWSEYFKGDDGEYFKLELQENNYVCTLEKELKNFKLLKPNGKKGFLTKFEENPTISKIGLFIVLPIVSGLGGSGHMQGGAPYILVFLTIFLFPYLLKETIKNIVFYKFLKQIEEKENVTIYNGNIKPEDNPMEQIWRRYQ